MLLAREACVARRWPVTEKGVTPETPLTVELQQATLRAVVAAYHEINATFFRRSLRRPGFALSDAEGHLGRWVSQERTIELSRSLLTDHGWGVVTEVLKHEMAHQYVDEVLGVQQSAHGPAFRRVCEERGFDSSSAGTPPSANTDDRHGKILDRVAKLLALATSPNQHEAEVAMSTAQRLMLKHNIEWVSQQDRRFAFRHLGKPSGRVHEAQRVLASILSGHFFVQVIWVPVWRPLEGKRGSVLEVCGSDANLELASYVYDFLMHTAERLWREHKKQSGIRSNRDRLSFHAGVMAGFRDRLQRDAKQNTERGLVWIGDPELNQFLRSRHPHIRWTHYRAAGRSQAYGDGRAAGERIVLHRGVKESGKSPVRLLSGR